MGNETGRIHLLQVHAKNVKGIREVAIDIDGNVHEIRGDSGQGKTTIIQSVRAALEGMDPAMVRNGSTAAEIQLVLDDATIRRTIPKDPDGEETLMVTTGDGKAMAKDKAKAFLKTICGRGVFNPVAWVQLGGGENKGRTERLREQRKQLLESIPLTMTEQDVWDFVNALGDEYVDALEQVNTDGVDLEAQHPFVACKALEEACFNLRAVKNVQKEDAENRLKLAPAPERAAPKMSVAECQAVVVAAREAYYGAKGAMDANRNQAEEAEKLRETIAEEAATLPKRVDAEKTLKHHEGERDKCHRLGEELQAEIKDVEANLARLKAQREEVISQEERATEKAREAEGLLRRIDQNDARKRDLARIESELGEGKVFDTVKLERAMRDAEANLEARKLQDAHDAAAKVVAEASATAARYTRLVELFRDEIPKALLAQANLGIEGLGVDSDRITVNGVPLHQLGTSQQISIGVRVAAAVNPRSGFVLVDGAESMGGKDRRALAEAAAAMGLQLIMTFVDDDPALTSGPGLTVMEKFKVKGQAA